MLTWLIHRFDNWWLGSIDIGNIHSIILYDLMTQRLIHSLLLTGNAYCDMDFYVGIDYAKKDNADYTVVQKIPPE